MRVLDHRKGVPALEEIGMSAAALEETARSSCATSTG